MSSVRGCPKIWTFFLRCHFYNVIFYKSVMLSAAYTCKSMCPFVFRNTLFQPYNGLGLLPLKWEFYCLTPIEGREAGAFLVPKPFFSNIGSLLSPHITGTRSTPRLRSSVLYLSAFWIADETVSFFPANITYIYIYYLDHKKLRTRVGAKLYTVALRLKTKLHKIAGCI